MDQTLNYLRRKPEAGLEVALPEHDYIISRDASIDGIENETYWFTFHVPERDLHGTAYIWCHSQLRTATAYVLIWQGVKRYVWQAEHFNCYNYLPWPTFAGDDNGLPTSITLDELGLTLRIIEPHVRHEIIYDHPETRTSLRLTTRALLPSVKAIGRNHLEQPMHLTGELVLNGERIAIDSYSTRDRSWRGKRPEAGAIFPPLTYANGITNDGLTMWNFCGADDPDRGAPWRDRYNVPREALLLEGWIYREGQLAKLVDMSKTSIFDTNDFMRQTGWTCELVDELGRRHRIRAKRKAAIPFAPWASIWNDWGSFSFEMDDDAPGMVITNDFFFNDYARGVPLIGGDAHG